ncbi:MAG: CinA family nicotinamide mononucleotide deamidase-related protein [Bacteroidales bacterium]|nr:CinA family nicotinamide mononucleotide deamidase-related protein [Bacteroidales bacterium]
MIQASVCTIGDEILIGQITDTNSAMIARALGAAGISVRRMVSIGDNREDILDTLRKELSLSDIVITTGGLGPTKDDITKGVLAELSGSNSYVEHEGQMEMVVKILSSRGLDILDINRAQAMVPDTCKVIVNRRGTAPIMVFPIGRSTLYSMPGVPFETEAALPDVVQDIVSRYPVSCIKHRNIMTYGLAESALSKKIASWEDSLPSDMHLAYLPNPLSGVKLRLSLVGDDSSRAETRLDGKIAELEAILGENIYSCEEESLARTIGKLLKSLGKTVSAAESCTGGEISHLFTSVAGASSWYLGSVTSYAISVKESVLGVPKRIIEEKGVVSAEVAEAMAAGVRKLTGSDYAVATTGLAGPGGDGVNPEGTVWIAVCSEKGTQSRKYNYSNDRLRNIERFSASALYFLLTFIKNEINH